MDRVALGRALGFGARQAAQTLMKVADAATTPAPDARVVEPAARAAVPAESEARPSARVQTVRQPSGPSRGLGNAVLKPVARFTSVLWLEVTGLFYGVFAAILGTAAWRQWSRVFAHGMAVASTGERTRFFICAGVGVVFVYFSMTNFWKARRRGRQ